MGHGRYSTRCSLRRSHVAKTSANPAFLLSLRGVVLIFWVYLGMKILLSDSLTSTADKEHTLFSGFIDKFNFQKFNFGLTTILTAKETSDQRSLHLNTSHGVYIHPSQSSSNSQRIFSQTSHFQLTYLFLTPSNQLGSPQRSGLSSRLFHHHYPALPSLLRV